MEHPPSGDLAKSPQLTISFTRQELEAVISESGSHAAKIVDLLESDFSDPLDQSVGVWEGYTLRQHTNMVLGQLGKYVAAHSLPQELGMSSFTMMVGLHDMGKPRALQEGKKIDTTAGLYGGRDKDIRNSC